MLVKDLLDASTNIEKYNKNIDNDSALWPAPLVIHFLDLYVDFPSQLCQQQGAQQKHFWLFKILIQFDPLKALACQLLAPTDNRNEIQHKIHTSHNNLGMLSLNVQC
uniref:Uncharacterized protein n=1 Tax=Romanomermis culicivorax TaxID=13658 RepID=A0A915ILR3_ROMCU